MKKISIIIIIVSILMPSIVFAASAFQVELASDKTEAKVGETVTISISLANLSITTGEQGIGAYLAKIEYDTEIFEKAVFSGNSNWEGSMNNGNITGVTVDGKVVKQAQTIATLSLTVKENAKVGNTTITISNFVGTDAVNDISADSKSINIKVIEENKNQNQEDSDKNETNDENNTNTDSNETNNNKPNNGGSNSTNSNNSINNNTNNNSNNNSNTGTTNTTTNNTNSETNTDNDNQNSDESDNVDSDNDADNNSNNNDNTSTIDKTTNSTNPETSEQLSETENKIVLYGVLVAIILVLIVVIYIYYRKLKQK